MNGKPVIDQPGGPAALEKSVTPPDKRLLGLDILRFVAVSFVLFRHAQSFNCPPDSSFWCVWVQKIADALGNVGWVGVDIFFVLSGFLISGLLFREWQQRYEVSLGRFLLRRGLKIYPSFWFFLMRMVLLAEIQHRPIDGRGLLGELLFLQNCWANLFFHT